MKKSAWLLMVVCIYVSIPTVYADTEWYNTSGDRRWDNPTNWDAGIPDSADKAGIRHSIPDGPIIDSVTSAVANTIVCGDWGSTDNTLEITGGSLTISGWFILGYGASDEGTFNVSGGTTTCNSHMDVGFKGAGHMTMTGGTVTVNGTFGISLDSDGLGTSSGDVQLDSGSITCDAFTMKSGGSLDITNGTLIVKGDVRSTVNGYVNNGWITAYGGAGNLNVDITTNTGKTTVWAEEGSPTLGNGDINGDGYVDDTDLLLFVAEWLDPNPDPDADFTRDGEVQMDDYQILAKNWLRNEYSKTLTGKIMCGYQGWFNAPGDGAGRGWVHWGSSNKFEPGYCTVDWWPDMSEYDADEKFPTGFQYADTSTAYVFSSYKEKTVLRHFSWMADYGIDGVFLQRFVSETTPGSTARNHRDQVMLHCREGANQYKRAWAMMYDLSSSYTGPQLKQKVIDDWKHLVDTYQITQDPSDGAYLHHKGKPVVAVWGLGFGRSYEGQETYEMIDFLKNDPVYGGCTIMIGVQNSWRTNTDPWFRQIVDLADIISPWAVGRYGSIYESELNNFTNTYTIPDQNWCNANNKDYLPVVFPGFSWQNLQQNNKFDQTPRRGGRFLWRQYYKAIHDGGATMIYQAMFDEVDEGTAIFKVTNNPPVSELPTSVFSNPFLPTGNTQYAPYDLNDALLPSDHYLWLVGQGTKMLRGKIPLSATMPTRQPNK